MENVLLCAVSWHPKFLIFTNQAPALLYYSHIPAAIISLAVALFVFLKSKRSLAGTILLIMSIVFSLWAFLDLLVWVGDNSRVMYFSWSFFGILFVIIYVLSLYLSYVFFDGKDVSFLKKIIIFLPILPVAILTPTRYNLNFFDIVGCGIKENKYFIDFYHGLGFLISLWIIFLAISRFRKSKITEFRKKIVYFTIGIEFFLFSFLTTGFIASYLYGEGSAGGFKLEQYGLLSMAFFMFMLGYIIVKFKAFNVKIIGAQALVVVLVVLVGALLFVGDISTARIVAGITLAISLIIGIYLIRSVKKEVEQKEALEIANKEINERKEQLQLMADSLAQANDQLRKLDNAKTEFISIASHQLRTPVTAVKGFASLLLEGSYGEVSDDVRGALEKIYISSERLVNLIEDLLNVSRIESGRLTFEFADASVEKILKELYDNFMLIAKSKKFYLDLKMPKERLPEFKMDASKIRELISNFIDNALKYTEKGGVTISAEMKDAGTVIDDQGFVKVGEKAPFGKVVRITVSDTGIGIPKEEIPYLFRKFSRGKDVSRLHVGGTGLGLFVGKAIADAHHGATWVESDGAGMGSRFIIEIPISVAD